ncbi:Conserved_hypothetical protein [Hexamita inflata]|uniref:Uncharacterized protein n=1 Tax=Hexamita inflata TaxID=28002 RepID=A0AA86N885_9EUKA|nr:Conserved hypothetical protein [Hexamita inflata]
MIFSCVLAEFLEVNIQWIGNLRYPSKAYYVLVTMQPRNDSEFQEFTDVGPDMPKTCSEFSLKVKTGGKSIVPEFYSQYYTNNICEITFNVSKSMVGTSYLEFYRNNTLIGTPLQQNITNIIVTSYTNTIYIVATAGIITLSIIIVYIARRRDERKAALSALLVEMSNHQSLDTDYIQRLEDQQLKQFEEEQYKKNPLKKYDNSIECNWNQTCLEQHVKHAELWFNIFQLEKDVCVSAYFIKGNERVYKKDEIAQYLYNEQENFVIIVQKQQFSGYKAGELLKICDKEDTDTEVSNQPDSNFTYANYVIELLQEERRIIDQEHVFVDRIHQQMYENIQLQSNASQMMTMDTDAVDIFSQVQAKLNSQNITNLQQVVQSLQEQEVQPPEDNVPPPQQPEFEKMFTAEIDEQNMLPQNDFMNFNYGQDEQTQQLLPVLAQIMRDQMQLTDQYSYKRRPDQQTQMDNQLPVFDEDSDQTNESDMMKLQQISKQPSLVNLHEKPPTGKTSMPAKIDEDFELPAFGFGGSKDVLGNLPTFKPIDVNIGNDLKNLLSGLPIAPVNSNNDTEMMLPSFDFQNNLPTFNELDQSVKSSTPVINDDAMDLPFFGDNENEMLSLPSFQQNPVENIVPGLDNLQLPAFEANAMDLPMFQNPEGNNDGIDLPIFQNANVENNDGMNLPMFQNAEENKDMNLPVFQNPIESNNNAMDLPMFQNVATENNETMDLPMFQNMATESNNEGMDLPMCQNNNIAVESNNEVLDLPMFQNPMEIDTNNDAMDLPMFQNPIETNNVDLPLQFEQQPKINFDLPAFETQNEMQSLPSFQQIKATEEPLVLPTFDNFEPTLPQIPETQVQSIVAQAEVKTESNELPEPCFDLPVFDNISEVLNRQALEMQQADTNEELPLVQDIGFNLPIFQKDNEQFEVEMILPSFELPVLPSVENQFMNGARTPEQWESNQDNPKIYKNNVSVEHHPILQNKILAQGQSELPKVLEHQNSYLQGLPEIESIDGVLDNDKTEVTSDVRSEVRSDTMRFNPYSGARSPISGSISIGQIAVNMASNLQSHQISQNDNNTVHNDLLQQDFLTEEVFVNYRDGFERRKQEINIIEKPHITSNLASCTNISSLFKSSKYFRLCFAAKICQELHNQNPNCLFLNVNFTVNVQEIQIQNKIVNLKIQLFNRSDINFSCMLNQMFPSYDAIPFKRLQVLSFVLFCAQITYQKQMDFQTFLGHVAKHFDDVGIYLLQFSLQENVAEVIRMMIE